MSNLKQAWRVWRNGLPDLPTITIEYGRRGDTIITSLEYEGRVEGVFNGELLSSYNGTFTIEQLITTGINWPMSLPELTGVVGDPDA